MIDIELSKTWFDDSKDTNLKELEDLSNDIFNFLIKNYTNTLEKLFLKLLKAMNGKAISQRIKLKGILNQKLDILKKTLFAYIKPLFVVVHKIGRNSAIFEMQNKKNKIVNEEYLFNESEKFLNSFFQQLFYKVIDINNIKILNSFYSYNFELLLNDKKENNTMKKFLKNVSNLEIDKDISKEIYSFLLFLYNISKYETFVNNKIFVLKFKEEKIDFRNNGFFNYYPKYIYDLIIKDDKFKLKLE